MAYFRTVDQVQVDVFESELEWANREVSSSHFDPSPTALPAEEIASKIHADR